MPQLSTPPDANSALITWALWYAEQGWPVFPCHGKAPALPSAHPVGDPLRGVCTGGCGKQGHGFYDASCEETQIFAWWNQWPMANIGSPTGVWAWVIDEDPRNAGDTTRRQLEQRYGTLPDTLLALSGRRDGGCHRYWLLPDTATIRHKAPLGDGLDVLAQGGYTILPPSIHPDTGQPYLWDLVYGIDEYGPREAPPWLLHLVCGVGKVAQSIFPSTLPSSIPEGQRENTLTRMAGALRRTGATSDELLISLQAINQRCVPPLLTTDLERIAQSIGRYDIPPALVVQGNGSAPSVPPAPSRQTLDHTTALTAQTLMRLMIVPPRFLVHELVPDGLTILAAPSKSFKTYFSLSLALATLGVQDWCGSFPVEECGNVVFFALESSPAQLRVRLHQLCPEFDPQQIVHQLTFFTGMRVLPTFKEGLQDMIEEVIDTYKPRLIVIDPMSYLYRLGRNDELSSATIDLLWPLADLVASRQVALFAPEHMRKASKDDVSIVDRLAGSHMKSAIVHALLTLTKEEDMLLINTIMRDAPSQTIALTMEFSADGQAVTWGYRGKNQASEERQARNTQARAILLLQDRAIPMTISEIRDALALMNTERSNARLRKGLSRAEQDGDLAKSRRGEYYYIRRATL